MEEKYGDIKFAVDALQQGKHVRRASWPKEAKLWLVTTNWGQHIDSSHPEYGMMTFCNFEHLIAKDWELAL